MLSDDDDDDDEEVEADLFEFNETDRDTDEPTLLCDWLRNDEDDDLRRPLCTSLLDFFALLFSELLLELTARSAAPLPLIFGCLVNFFFSFRISEDEVEEDEEEEEDDEPDEDVDEMDELDVMEEDDSDDMDIFISSSSPILLRLFFRFVFLDDLCCFLLCLATKSADFDLDVYARLLLDFLFLLFVVKSGLIKYAFDFLL